MRLIDVDALVKVKFHGYPEIEITPSDVNAEAYKRGWNDAIDAIIESAPSIDAVPVVRCKNCEHRDRHGHRCKVWNHGINVEDFCSHAERKEK